MKRTIFLLCFTRETLKALIVMAVIVLISLPGAWAENGQSLVLVLLAMVGCAAIICGLWRMECHTDYRVFCLRREQARQARIEQLEREAPLREAQRRREWQRWLAEQEEA